MTQATLHAVPGHEVPPGAEGSVLETTDAVALRVARWPASTTATTRGTVLLFHGYTEFIEKYYEVIQELRARSEEALGDSQSDFGAGAGSPWGLQEASTKVESAARAKRLRSSLPPAWRSTSDPGGKTRPGLGHCDRNTRHGLARLPAARFPGSGACQPHLAAPRIGRPSRMPRRPELV